MSWFGPPSTTEQAQMIVNSMQGEINGREERISELETQLASEKSLHYDLVQQEIYTLKERKTSLMTSLHAIEEELKKKSMELTHLKMEKTKKTTREAVKKKEENDVETKKIIMVSKAKNNGNTMDNAKDNGVNPAMNGPMKEKSENVEEKKAVVVVKEKKPQAKKTQNVEKMEEKKKTVIVHPQELQEAMAKDPQTLFIVQRSSNKNTIVYACPPHALKPMDVYWIMYEQEGHPREELNMIERNTAYGMNVVGHSNGRTGHHAVTLVSIKDRELHLRCDTTTPTITCTMSAVKEVHLQRVFVQATTRWGMPAVEYIELFGWDAVAQKPVYEKINKQ